MMTKHLSENDTAEKPALQEGDDVIFMKKKKNSLYESRNNNKK